MLKKLLTGLTVSRQYVCLPLEELEHPLSVFLTTQDSDGFHDVTSSHVLLGYKPLLVLLPHAAISESTETVCLNFVQNGFRSDMRWWGFATTQDCVARVILKKLTSIPLGGTDRFIFEGVHGHHHFLNQFHQLVNRQRERFRKNKPDNVDLPGNLHDQVRIAYSVPRIIPLITLGDRNAMNMFPTDLHGHVDDVHYVSSLRIGGKANSQVEQHGKLAISFMPATEFRFVYSLGKNHMQELRNSDAFATSKQLSETNGIPVPGLALRYIELSTIASIDAGIHRIHFYRKIGQANLSQGKTLAHIHQFYAQWRLNQGLPTPLLIR